jgi:Cu2+-exporting ATPase
MAPATCFHCGEPIPPGVALEVLIGGEQRPVCCGGCQAAAEFIRDAGLDRYYDFRAAPAPRPDDIAGDAWVAYDRPDIQSRLVTMTDGTSSVNLLLEGLRCPACAWLVERRLVSSASRSIPRRRAPASSGAVTRPHFPVCCARSTLSATGPMCSAPRTRSR